MLNLILSLLIIQQNQTAVKNLIMTPRKELVSKHRHSTPHRSSSPILWIICPITKVTASSMSLQFGSHRVATVLISPWGARAYHAASPARGSSESPRQGCRCYRQGRQSRDHCRNGLANVAHMACDKKDSLWNNPQEDQGDGIVMTNVIKAGEELVEPCW